MSSKTPTFSRGTYNPHDRAVHMTLGPMLDNVHVAVHARQERAEAIAEFIQEAPELLADLLKIAKKAPAWATGTVIKTENLLAKIGA